MRASKPRDCATLAFLARLEFENSALSPTSRLILLSTLRAGNLCHIKSFVVTSKADTSRDDFLDSPWKQLVARGSLSFERCLLLALAVCASIASPLRAQSDLPPLTGPERQPIVVGLPIPSAGPSGELVVQPNVNSANQLPAGLSQYQNPFAGGAMPGGSAGATDNYPATGGSIYTRQSAISAPASLNVVAQTPPASPPHVPTSQLPPYQYQPPFSQSAAQGANNIQAAYSQLPTSRVLVARQPAPMPPGPPSGSSEELPPAVAPGAAPSVDPSVVDPNSPAAVAQPIFAQTLSTGCGCGHGCGCGGSSGSCSGKGTWYGLGDAKPCADGGGGIGHERVMFALFDIENSQPESDLKMQFNAVYHEKDPDRAEFFWSEIGVLGPKLPEPFVDWQSVNTSLELASGKSFSVTTEIPLELLDPVNNPNTAGLGDLQIKTKTVLLNGNSWQITQYMDIYTPTGDSMKGLGTGHVSLEPGFLFQYKWSPETYLHGELRYWFPIGGDPIFGGQVLRYGFGISHLLYENDTFAAIPTLEFVGWTVFDGMQSSPLGIPQMVDTMGIFNIEPGIRFASDTGGDLGVIDWGFHASFAVTQNRWFNASLMAEIRFLFQ